MKGKRVIVILLLSVVTVIMAVLGLYSNYKHSSYAQDSEWLKLCRNAGFLNSPGMAIDSYANAIEILQKYGVDVQFIEKYQPNEQNSTIPDTASDKVVQEVLKGARTKRLGVRIRRPEPFTMEIYTPDDRKFECKNFKLLSKAISYFAKVELAEKADIDKATLLGYANLALGTQLSTHNDIILRACGVACKDTGLEVLKECAITQNDESLMTLVLRMRQILDKEFEVVMNLPDNLPSRWKLFKYVTKSESDVNESE